MTSLCRSRCRELGLPIVTPLLCFFAALVFLSSSRASLRLDTAELRLLFSSSQCRAFGLIARDESWRSISNDEELMQRAATVSCGEVEDVGSGKVAFMFLSRGGMPLRLLWEKFFHGHGRELFSVYLHASPEYVEELPPSSVFLGRRIPTSGMGLFVDDRRSRLLASALLDPSNRWFVLLSESCIPLFSFTRIRSYLTNSRLSFLGSFDDPGKTGRGRYNRRMHPNITLQDWRKGSQWFAIHRTLAVDIVSDRKYYPLFQEYCRPPCYMDEHYLPTMVTKRLSGLNSNRSVTWADWSRGGSHPMTYRRKDVTVALVERMRQGGGCDYNGNASEVCFMFARKFDRSTLKPLMGLAQILYGSDPRGCNSFWFSVT